MEVEFNWKRLFLFGALLILAVALFAIWSVAPGMPFAEKRETPNTTPALSATQQIVASDVDINIDNQSSWKVEGVDACLPAFKTWLDDYPLESLTVIFTDTVTPDMALSVSQSGKGHPDAEVTGQCEEKEADNLLCTIAIKQGEPSPNLDVAATVELAWLIKEFYRPKTKETWEGQTGKNTLSDFQPLIKKENDEWTSQCLHVKH